VEIGRFVPTEEPHEKISRIEGIVTIAFMLAVTTSVALLMLRGTQRSAAYGVALQTQAIVERELDRIVATPFATLPARAGCEVARGDFPHTRCITVSALSPDVRRVTLVVAPARRKARPDTVVIDRASAAARPLRKP
jgi:hypothetical protein